MFMSLIVLGKQESWKKLVVISFATIGLTLWVHKGLQKISTSEKIRMWKFGIEKMHSILVCELFYQVALDIGS
jgi:hypothetical protein